MRTQIQVKLYLYDFYFILCMHEFICGFVLLFTEIPFKMYQRGCYYALPANVPSNGCHNRNSINEDKTFLKQIVDRTTSALSDWDVANFQGKLCLCSDTYCQTSGVSQGEIMYPLLFVVQLLALITYLF